MKMNRSEDLNKPTAWLISVGIVLRAYLDASRNFWEWRLDLWRHPDHLMEQTKTQTLLFIRHGQSIYNVSHQLPGQLPGIDLTDEGRAQAARLGDALSSLPITAVVSSPLERARDTAAAVAGPHDLELDFEPDLMDTDVGPWAGQNFEKLYKEDADWQAYVRNPNQSTLAGVETFAQVQKRAVAAVERWRQNGESGKCIAFVAHADVIKLLLAHYIDLDSARAGMFMIDNASVSIVLVEPDGRTRQQAINWTPQPGWLKLPAITEATEQQNDSGNAAK